MRGQESVWAGHRLWSQFSSSPCLAAASYCMQQQAIVSTCSTELLNLPIASNYLGAVHILRKHILGSLNTLGGVVSTW